MHISGLWGTHIHHRRTAELGRSLAAIGRVCAGNICDEGYGDVAHGDGCVVGRCRNQVYTVSAFSCICGMRFVILMSMVTGEMEARMKRNHDRGIKSYLANAYILLHLIRSGVRVFYKTFALRLYGEALQKHHWYNISQSSAMSSLESFYNKSWIESYSFHFSTIRPIHIYELDPSLWYRIPRIRNGEMRRLNQRETNMIS